MNTDVFGDTYAEIINEYVATLKKFQNEWIDKKRKHEVEKGIANKSFTVISNNPKSGEVIAGVSIPYLPFDGHLPMLSHYYRHLYHIATYVDKQNENMLSLDDKKKYMKTLRAQLSSHEQMLLYYNSLTVLGQPWTEKIEGESLLDKYKLIKNIPVPFADLDNGIRSRYPDENYFEWDEMKNRLQNLIQNE